MSSCVTDLHLHLTNPYVHNYYIFCPVPAAMVVSQVAFSSNRHALMNQKHECAIQTSAF